MSSPPEAPAGAMYVQVPVTIEVYQHVNATRPTIRIELVHEVGEDRFAAILGELPDGYAKRDFTLSRDGRVIGVEPMPLFHPAGLVDEAACALGRFFGQYLGFADFWLTRLDGKLEHYLTYEDVGRHDSEAGSVTA